MRKSLLLCLPICLSLFFPVLAQRTSTDVPVTSIITDSVDVGTPESPVLVDMQIQSDGDGPYQTIINRKSFDVKSIIQGNGDWELDTLINVVTLTRTIRLDFSNPVPNSKPDGSTPVPLFPVGQEVYAHFRCQASRYGNNFFTIPNGQTVNGPLLLGFDYPSGTRYRIHMTPDDSAINPYPTTDDVNITCLGATSGQCNRWQITPTGVKGGSVPGAPSLLRNVGKLVKVVTSKGKITEIDMGDFYFAFAIEITKP